MEYPADLQTGIAAETTRLAEAMRIPGIEAAMAEAGRLADAMRLQPGLEAAMATNLGIAELAKAIVPETSALTALTDQLLRTEAGIAAEMHRQDMARQAMFDRTLDVVARMPSPRQQLEQRLMLAEDRIAELEEEKEQMARQLRVHEVDVWAHGERLNNLEDRATETEDYIRDRDS